MILCTLLGEITNELCLEAHMAISQAEFQKCPITFYICSEGGDVDSGTSLAIRLKNAKVKVITHALGNVSSIALLIFAAGKVRMCSKYTIFLYHEISAEVSLKKVSHIARSLKLRQRDNVRMNQMLSEYSGLSASLLSRHSSSDFDWEFGALEAKRLNFIHKIYDEANNV